VTITQPTQPDPEPSARTAALSVAAFLDGHPQFDAAPNISWHISRAGARHVEVCTGYLRDDTREQTFALAALLSFTVEQYPLVSSTTGDPIIQLYGRGVYRGVPWRLVGHIPDDCGLFLRDHDPDPQNWGPQDRAAYARLAKPELAVAV